MEKAVGIICEFNPFHFGHSYLLKRVKEAFPEKGIVCVMSGNFVQRGSFAIQEKYSRARSALLGGADLVLELPFPFSCLSAESFASAAVSILSGIGICDTLAFGTEIADEKELLSCAENLSSSMFQDALKDHLSHHPGTGFPSAREVVYGELFGQTPILSLPNASLAVSYLAALREQNAPLTPFAVERKGEGIRSMKQEGEFLSATALRHRVEKGLELSGLVPEYTLEEVERERCEGRFPVSMEALSPVLFYLLKTKSRKELCGLYGFSALCDRARRFAGECETIGELVEKMKNPSFTDSRIRRGLLALLCDIPRHAEKEMPAYTTVLAANEKGREMLSAMKEVSTLTVFTKPAHGLKAASLPVKRQFSRAALADEIYAMAFPKKQEEGFFLKKIPYIG